MSNTIDVEQFEQAVATLAEAVQPVADALHQWFMGFKAWFDELIETNPYVAALVRQANQQQPRGLVHPASRVGRERHNG